MVNLPGLTGGLNLHPMVVHFPIVLILLAVVSEILHVSLKNEFYGRAAGILLNLAAISAVVAVYLGYQAADAVGHDSPGHDRVHVHRDIMLWFTGLTVVIAGIFQFIKSSRKGYYRLIALAAVSVILIIGADRGADLVFNYGVGTHIKEMSQEMPGHHEEGEDSDHDGDEDHEQEAHDDDHSDGHSH
ncbi:MAG: hypothetical protein GXO91_06475 [FCB group bacterium]|nr:hypothetical protein [FCB group bacterium]